MAIEMPGNGEYKQWSKYYDGSGYLPDPKPVPEGRTVHNHELTAQGGKPNPQHDLHTFHIPIGQAAQVYELRRLLRL